MAVRIEVTGRIYKIRRVRSPKYRWQHWFLIDIIAGGRTPQPKDLPNPDELKYTIFTSESQFRKIEKKLNENSVPLKEGTIIVRGELTSSKNLVQKYVQGDAGIVAYQLDCFDRVIQAAASVRLDITGKMKKVKEMPNPLNDGQRWFIIQFLEGGTVPQPSELPEPKRLLYSVFMNEKQYRGLEKELQKKKLNIKECMLWVRGDLIIREELKQFIEGHIGVVAYQVGDLDKKSEVDRKEYENALRKAAEAAAAKLKQQDEVIQDKSEEAS